MLYCFGVMHKTENRCRMTAWNFYNGKSRFWLTCVTRCQLQQCRKQINRSGETTKGFCLGNTWRSAMNSDPTSWDCPLDRYNRWNRGFPKRPRCRTSAEGAPSGVAMPVGSASENITAPRRSAVALFQQSHFDHGWLEPWSILWKQHCAIYCMWKWCLLIEISQSSFDPI